MLLNTLLFFLPTDIMSPNMMILLQFFTTHSCFNPPSLLNLTMHQSERGTNIQVTEWLSTLKLSFIDAFKSSLAPKFGKIKQVVVVSDMVIYCFLCG